MLSIPYKYLCDLRMVSYDEPLPPAGDGEGLEDCGGNQESGEQLCVLLQQEERAHRASVSGASI